MLRVMLQYSEKATWFLSHANAPVHSAMMVKWFMVNRVVLNSQPTHLSDLVPSYLFIFPKVKSALKGRRFQVVENIKKNINAVPLDAFDDSFV
jgi:hypothetical protein